MPLPDILDVFRKLHDKAQAQPGLFEMVYVISHDSELLTRQDCEWADTNDCDDPKNSSQAA